MQLSISNYERIYTILEILTHKLENGLYLPVLPCLTPPLKRSLSKFLDDTYP